MAGFLDGQSAANIMEAIYIDYFGRAADGGGYLFWTNTYASEIAQGLPSTTAAVNIANSFAVQNEAKSTYGFLASPPPVLSPTDPVQIAGVTSLIETAYGDLFNRVADSGGLAYWTNQILSGQVAVGAALYTIANGAQANDASILGFKIAAAADFTAVSFANPAAVPPSSFLAVAKAAVASVVDAATLAASEAATQALVTPTTTTAVLTTNIDNVTATNIVGSLTPFFVDGHGPTLNPGDTLNGTFGSTNNQLILTDLTPNAANDIIPSGVTINNVQKVVLNSSGNTAPQGFNTTAFASVNNLSVTTAGVGVDVVQAGNGTNGTTATTVAVNHTSNIGGGVTALGGSAVTVNANGSGGAVLVGLVGPGTVPPAANVASGVITVNSTNTGGGAIDVVGGSSVTVSATSASFTGAINVGNDGANTGNSLAGALANTAGAITIQDAGVGPGAGPGAGSPVTVFGGAAVNVTAAGDAVLVGDATAKIASNEATGLVTVADTAPTAYDGLAGAIIGGTHNAVAALVSVFGGSGVLVTTNAGGVTVGTPNAVVGANTIGDVTVTDTANDQTDAVLGNAAVTVFGGGAVVVNAQDDNVLLGGALSAKAEATGAVTVTETGASTLQDLAAAGAHTINIDGGNGVTVTAAGQNVTIGANFGTAGAQLVKETGVLTGAGLGLGNGTVTVDGGSTVTVTTTGGNVAVGNVNFQPTGAVVITDNFGSGNATADAITVQGGTAVTVTVASADTAAITVGVAAVLNAAGTNLKNASQDATGNVTIVDDQTNTQTVGTTTTTTTTYGTGAVNVFSNGATTDSITGGAVAHVVDVEATLATGVGMNGAGKAVGTSTLATVILDGVQTGGAVAVTTDALTSLSILDNKVAGNAYNVTDNTAGYALGLTLNNDSKAFAVTDTAAGGAAGSITVGDNGGASTGMATITAVAAKTLTVNTTATANLNVAGDAALTTITLANKGALNLNSVAGLGNLTAINAATATGSIQVALNPATTSFNGTGSTGAETVGLSQNALGTGVKIVGGTPVTGVNTLVANYNAALADTALGSSTQGFSTLAVLGAFQSDAHTGTVYQPTVAAQAEVVTVTVTNAVVGDVYTAAIAGNPTVSYTAIAGDTTSTISAQLAGKLFSQANAGFLVGSPAGASFTVTATGAQVGAAFAVTNPGSTGTLTDVITTANVAANAGDAFYDASGFTSGLTVGATSGDVTFKNVAAGATLSVGVPTTTGLATVSPGGVINYLLATTKASSTLPLTVGVDGTASVLGGGGAVVTPGTGTTSIAATIATTGVPTLTIASLGEVKSASGATQTNTVTIGDTAATNITITGDQALTLTLKTDGLSVLTEATSHVTSIDASAATGAVNVTGVALANNAAHTIKGGSGALTAVGGTNPLDADTFVVGTGGGAITVGSGGQWAQTPAQMAAVPPTGSYSSGSETVILSSVAGAKVATLNVADGVVSTQATSGGATVGGVSNFVDAVTAADVLSYTTAKTILKNSGPAKTALTSLPGEAAMAAALGIGTGSSALADLNNLSYTVANGVISFDTAAGGALLSSYTTQELVSAAEIILNATGASLIAEFSQGGNSFIVTDDALQTLAGVTGANQDSVMELVGVSGVVGFGTTGAANTVDVKGVSLINANSANTGSATAQVYDDTAFAQVTISTGVGASFAPTVSVASEHGTQSYTLNNLAGSAIVNVDSGAGATPHIGDLVVNQSGAAGGLSLTVNVGSAGNPTILDSLTVSGDAALTLTSGSSGLIDSAVTSLVDATNSLSTLTIGGTHSISVHAATSTSLASISITDTNTVTLFNTAAFSGVLTVTDAGTGGVPGGGLIIGDIATSSFGLTGNGDTVSIGTASVNNNAVSNLLLSGTGDHITIDGTGNDTIVASGANDTITVGDTVNGIGSDTITATGTGNTVTLLGTNGAAVVNVTVGNSAQVNLSSTAAHFTPETVTITGDATGGTSASFLFTTVNHAADGAGQSLVFNNVVTELMAGGSVANSLVNVASVSTLPAALDLAASQAALAFSPNPNTTTFGQIAKATGVIDWIQFQGNTYIVEAVNSGTTPAAHTALGSHDVVVELTGLVNIGAGGGFGVHALTL
jgi:hypothetical protein